MGYYSMTLIFASTSAKFIFPTWDTSDSLVGFIIGCLVTLLLAMFSMALPRIKEKIQKLLFSNGHSSSVRDQYHELVQDFENRQKESIRMTSSQMLMKKRVIPFFYSLIFSILHVGIMLVMMTMNIYVILAIIIGYTSGFFVFSESCRIKKGSKCGEGCHQKGKN